MPSELEQWAVDLCRLTFLFPSPELPEPNPLWGKIMGGTPERVEESPRSRTRDEQGTYRESQCRIVQSPGRIDLFVKSIDRAPPKGNLSIGSYVNASSELRKLARSASPHMANCTRLAMGVVLQRQVQDVNEGIDIIRRLLPDWKILPNSLDIVWQINHPTQSALLPNVQLNILRKIQLAQIQHFVVAPGMSSLQSKINVVQFEIDFSTGQDRTEPYLKEHLITLGDELVQHADELVSKGDAR